MMRSCKEVGDASAANHQFTRVSLMRRVLDHLSPLRNASKKHSTVEFDLDGRGQDDSLGDGDGIPKRLDIHCVVLLSQLSAVKGDNSLGACQQVNYFPYSVLNSTPFKGLTLLYNDNMYKYIRQVSTTP